MQIITDDVKDTQKASDFIFMKAALLVVVVVLTLCYDGLKNNSYSKEPFQNIPIGDTVQGDVDDGLWDGPILFYKGNGKPIHLILVEKALGQRNNGQPVVDPLVLGRVEPLRQIGCKQKYQERLERTLDKNNQLNSPLQLGRRTVPILNQ